MRGESLALASAACFAVANAAVARGAPPGAEDNGAFLSLLLSFAISGALWLALGLAHRFAPVTPESLLWLAGAGVFTAFIGRVFLYASIQCLGSMRASAVKRLNPFFAVLLGVLVLGEAISGVMAWGMAMIIASFIVLIADAWRSGPEPRESLGRRLLNLGYLYGPLSALGYAIGYLLRKMGLNVTPDPFFGTMIGTATGAAIFVVAGAFSPSYLRAVRATFQRPNAWLLAGGVMSSFGQILYFAALNVSAMSRVALLASMEVFITILLTVIILRERLSPKVAIAALLGVSGTALLVGV